MGVLKLLLFILLFYYLFKLIVRIVLPFILKYLMKKAEGNVYHFDTDKNKQEGEVTIEQNPKKDRNKDDLEGEYVDYEEVDE